MPVCTRCRATLSAGLTTCTYCKAPVMDVIRPADAVAPGGDRPASGRRAVAQPLDEPEAAGAVAPARALDFGSEEEEGDDRLVLLLEEPLPEMAAMIQEFLQNSGIACLLKTESIGLLYRLPLLGSAFSGARVYVRASDFVEARELVAHFFKKP